MFTKTLDCSLNSKLVTDIHSIPLKKTDDLVCDKMPKPKIKFGEFCWIEDGCKVEFDCIFCGKEFQILQHFLLHSFQKHLFVEEDQIKSILKDIFEYVKEKQSQSPQQLNILGEGTNEQGSEGLMKSPLIEIPDDLFPKLEINGFDTNNQLNEEVMSEASNHFNDSNDVSTVDLKFEGEETNTTPSKESHIRNPIGFEFLDTEMVVSPEFVAETDFAEMELSNKTTKRNTRKSKNIKSTKNNECAKSIQNIRKDAEDVLTCETCNKNFDKRLALRRHIKEEHPELKKTKKPKAVEELQCQICAEIFTKRVALRKHVKDQHGSENSSNCQDVICKDCGKEFETGIQLKRHSKLHEKSFVCEICGATCPTNSKLKEHINRHMGVKPHNCNLCDKSFVAKEDLKIHMRLHTGERPYVCSDCGRTFRSSVRLVVHRRRHTNERPYACTTCGKRFYEKKLLNNHKVSHTSDRPHVCGECKATFPRRTALREHMKLHSDVKKYVCNICAKAFAQQAGLVQHNKIHHTPRK